MERGRRYSKRRRLNGAEGSSRSDSGSPDELGASPPHQNHNGSVCRYDTAEPRGRSYPNSMSDRDSPDELGNATPLYPDLESEEDEHSEGNSPQRSSRSSTTTPIDTPADTPKDTTPVPTPKKIRYAPYRQKLVLKGHRRGVAFVRFSPDGRMVASCCE